jgi:hypothetical protein
MTFFSSLSNHAHRTLETRLSHSRPKGAGKETIVRSAILSTLMLGTACAQPAFAQSTDTAPDQTYAVHGQATLVVQGTGGFASPYAGDNSLTPSQTQETLDATLYVGVRPWKGAELWVNPEVDQGFGLSNTLGVAGFPAPRPTRSARATLTSSSTACSCARPSHWAGRRSRWTPPPTSCARRPRPTVSSSRRARSAWAMCSTPTNMPMIRAAIS